MRILWKKKICGHTADSYPGRLPVTQPTRILSRLPVTQPTRIPGRLQDTQLTLIPGRPPVTQPTRIPSRLQVTQLTQIPDRPQAEQSSRIFSRHPVTQPIRIPGRLPATQPTQTSSPQHPPISFMSRFESWATLYRRTVRRTGLGAGGCVPAHAHAVPRHHACPAILPGEPRAACQAARDDSEWGVSSLRRSPPPSTHASACADATPASADQGVPDPELQFNSVKGPLSLHCRIAFGRHGQTEAPAHIKGPGPANPAGLAGPAGPAGPALHLARPLPLVDRLSKAGLRTAGPVPSRPRVRD
jgi:hypothetical protein